jgi:hypothetical protein
VLVCRSAVPTVEAQVWRDYALLLAHARNALPPLSRGGEEKIQRLPILVRSKVETATLS